MDDKSEVASIHVDTKQREICELESEGVEYEYTEVIKRKRTRIGTAHTKRKKEAT